MAVLGHHSRVSLSRHLSLICCGRKRFYNRPWILPHSTQVGNQNHNWSFCGTSGSSPDNLKANESEMQTFLEQKLVVAPTRKRIVKIQDILTWVEAFTIYSIVFCAFQPARWADLSHYKLLIIQTAKKFPGKVWQLYDTAFLKNAAGSGLKDWSKINPDLYNFHTLVQTPSSSGTSHPKASASHSGLDHTPFHAVLPLVE